VLGKVAGKEHNKSIKPIEIGDLSMRTKNIAIDYKQRPTSLQLPDGTPECSLTTPWLTGYHGLFRIYLAVVSPKPEESQDNLPLSRRETKNVLKALSDAVIGMKETLRWQDSLR